MAPASLAASLQRISDVDFPNKAQRAAEEILTAECISIMEIDRYAADTRLTPSNRMMWSKRLLAHCT